MHRGLTAEIDLGALDNNLHVMRTVSGNTRVIGIVKADAYGLGAVEISKRMASRGVADFAVAYTEEAGLLREAGITSPIIVLFDQENPDDYFRYDLIPVIRDIRSARTFSDEAGRRGVTLSVHMKIDTGMGRLGFMPDAAVAAAVEIAGMKSLRLTGLMSHFSEADLVDRSYAQHQLKLFSEMRSGIMQKTGLKPLCHMANSAAVLSMPEALYDAVRPGIAIYGCSPFQEKFGLIPVMKLASRIVAIRNIPAGSPVSYGRTFVTKRDSRIAVVSVGYADGYSRLFSNNAEMLVRGQRVPVAGRVCMDLTMIDVTDVPDAEEGDEVVIIGRQGSCEITATELAGKINTISYEILTSLGPRALKEYLH